MHGTTLLLNAIIQQRGARVALVVSNGHRGILEIGRARLPSSQNFRVRKEEPLVSRELIFETNARITADGKIIGQPEPGEIEAIAARIKIERCRSRHRPAAAFLGVHPELVRNRSAPALQRVSARLGIPVTCSAQIWPERREFERSQIAIMNAAAIRN